MSVREFGVRQGLWPGGSRTWKVASELGYGRVLVSEFESEEYEAQRVQVYEQSSAESFSSSP